MYHHPSSGLLLPMIALLIATWLLGNAAAGGWMLTRHYRREHPRSAAARVLPVHTAGQRIALGKVRAS